ncbi:unnamed protein product, partial [Prorocentrum cordatum]
GVCVQAGPAVLAFGGHGSGEADDGGCDLEDGGWAERAVGGCAPGEPRRALRPRPRRFLLRPRRLLARSRVVSCLWASLGGRAGSVAVMALWKELVVIQMLGRGGDLRDVMDAVRRGGEGFSEDRALTLLLGIPEVAGACLAREVEYQ